MGDLFCDEWPHYSVWPKALAHLLLNAESTTHMVTHLLYKQKPMDGNYLCFCGNEGHKIMNSEGLWFPESRMDMDA